MVSLSARLNAGKRALVVFRPVRVTITGRVAHILAHRPDAQLFLYSLVKVLQSTCTRIPYDNGKGTDRN